MKIFILGNDLDHDTTKTENRECAVWVNHLPWVLLSRKRKERDACLVEGVRLKRLSWCPAKKDSLHARLTCVVTRVY